MLIDIVAKVTFFDNAINSFKFPVKNTIRVSIWFPNVSGTTPSEFVVDEKPLFLNELNIINVNIIWKEVLIKEIYLNSLFYIGSYNNTIGQGEIVKVNSIVY